MTDREALQAIRQGHRVEECFAALYRRHLDRVLRSLNRRTGCYDDALELAQETFVKLHGHAATLDPESDLEPWLAAVALNLFRSWQRSRRRLRRDERRLVPLRRPDGDGEGDGIEACIPDAWGWGVEAGVVAEEFQAYVARLPEAVRIVFHMKYIRGQSYRQIEELTGLSHEQIKHRLNVARQRYRDTFGRGLLAGRWER